MNQVNPSEALIGFALIIFWLGITVMTIFFPSWYLVILTSFIALMTGYYTTEMSYRYGTNQRYNLELSASLEQKPKLKGKRK